MGQVNNDVLIENENLFRALVCAPVAVLFVLLAANSVMTSAMLVMQILFIAMAIFFSLSTLAYASYYTNERYEGNAKPLIKNANLSKAILYTGLSALFTVVTYQTFADSTHLLFKAISVVILLYLSLSALAFFAYYTNEAMDS
ncbi:hypothetical protein [Thalassotalea sp. PS06]|uniref:hypothetical protein n=1 Tax=Thalassotalea sp. PS06 TaxID=2594005 RepID=UPI001164F1A1|nr:hypothetical protein [Thalassotalea sp. PS06]QDP01340.1 hypothetical protein FNC98_08325 [Thalassotalea sp. PS06]